MLPLHDNVPLKILSTKVISLTSFVCYTILMRKKLLITLTTLFLILCILSVGCVSQAPTPERATLFAMNTVIELTVYGDSAEEMVTRTIAELYRLEALFSVTRPNSDLARINTSSGTPVSVSAETIALLETGIDLWVKTNGAFAPGLFAISLAWGFTTDEHRIPEAEELTALLESIKMEQIQISNHNVTIPFGMKLDFGAIAKGYALDQIQQIAQELAIESALFSLGGEILALGTRPDGTAWRIGVLHPYTNEYLGIFEVSDKIIATSGRQERFFLGDDGQLYHHIFDPKTGHPVDNELASVTVLAPYGLGVATDAYATALFVMGLENGLAFIDEIDNIEAIFITQTGDFFQSKGASRYFTPTAP